MSNDAMNDPAVAGQAATDEGLVTNDGTDEAIDLALGTSGAAEPDPELSDDERAKLETDIELLWSALGTKLKTAAKYGVSVQLMCGSLCIATEQTVANQGDTRTERPEVDDG